MCIRDRVKKLADEEGSLALPICAKLEADIAELDDPDEKAMFMEELGLKQSGLDRLIQASYELLGLISFCLLYTSFVSGESLGNGGILDVFPVFQTVRMGQKIRCSAADDLFRDSLGIKSRPHPRI